MASKSKVTRLINLILYLSAHPNGAFAMDIHTDVEGYKENKSPEAFERQFRRDRHELKKMGFVILQKDLQTGMPANEPRKFYLNLSISKQDRLSLSPKELAFLKICVDNALKDPSFPMRKDLADALNVLPIGDLYSNATQSVATKKVSANRYGNSDTTPGDENRSVKIDQNNAIKSANIDFTPDVATDSSQLYQEILQLVAQAKHEELGIEFNYIPVYSDYADRRQVFPLRVFSYLGRLYLFAFDAQKRDVRRFRFDRFCNNPTPKLIETKRDIVLEAISHLYDLAVVLPFQIGEKHFEARLIFSKSAGQHCTKNDILTKTYGFGILEEHKDYWIWRIDAADKLALVSWVISNGPGIDILEPIDASNLLLETLDCTDCLRDHTDCLQDLEHIDTRKTDANSNEKGEDNV